MARELPSTYMYSRLCGEEIPVLSKLTILFLWNFVSNFGLENISPRVSIVLSVKLVYGRACWPR